MRQLLLIVMFAAEVFAQSLQLINGRADISAWQQLNVQTNLTHSIYPLANHTHLLILAPNYRSAGKEFSAVINDRSFMLQIASGDYKKEQIQVAKKFIQPGKTDPKLAARIKREYDEAVAIYAHSTPKSYLHRRFVLPLSSFITSPFGSARVFNDELKSYHSGTDFRATTGTLIPAANDGVVVIASNRYYAGGSVVIDHGWGIYTQYYHLSRIDVKPGEEVHRGDIIGLSGGTGRVSAPHFHLGVAVHGVSVDPLRFFTSINRFLNE